MQVKIKKLSPNAVIPSYAKSGDAGLDLTATRITIVDSYIEYGTDLAIEIPTGFFGLIRPRSSISKTCLVFNTSGIIDSGYRGEITIRFKAEKEYFLVNHMWVDIGYKTDESKLPKVGERIAQLIILPYPSIDLIEVDELSDSERGTGGYGSTGN